MDVEMHTCERLTKAIKEKKIVRLGGGDVSWPNPNYPKEPMKPLGVCPYCGAKMLRKLSG